MRMVPTIKICALFILLVGINSAYANNITEPGPSLGPTTSPQPGYVVTPQPGYVATPQPGNEANNLQPGAYEAKLDALLAAHDTTALTQIILNDVPDLTTALRGLNWLKTQETMYGGSSYIAYLYAALSYRASNNFPEPQKTGLRKNAVGQMLLAKWIIQTEGFQCADPSAPQSRVDLINAQLVDIIRYSPQLPQDEVNNIIRNMYGVLMLSFNKRGNDIWLCRGGADYWVKYFQKHPDEKGKEVSIPNTVGTNREFALDPTIMPDFVPYESWKDKRHAAIDKLLLQSGGRPTGIYMDAEHKMM